MAQKIDDELLTASTVSIAANVPQMTIRRWARDGLLTFRRDSTGRHLFNRESIEEAKKLRARKTYTLDGTSLRGRKRKARAVASDAQ
jgi:DNA-binding transcriptional MerR regulator